MTESRPTRETAAGRAYLDLQNLARRMRRPTDELHQLYALEGFLARLAGSEHADRLVLKGGVLLAAYDTRRPTRDIDLHARYLSNESDIVLGLIKDIAALPYDDGLVLDTGSATAQTIRGEDQYCGIRATIAGRLCTAKLNFHIDVNVGDPVTPAPTRIAIPKILGGELHLMGYPLVMVHAEKIVTAIARGAANTRWRDFADIYTLCHRHPISGDELHNSITTVPAHRGVTLTSVHTALAGYARSAQPRWAAWRRRQRLDDKIPEDLASVLDVVTRFADPALGGEANGCRWQPLELSWRDSASARG